MADQANGVSPATARRTTREDADISKLLQNNRAWSEECVAQDPTFFEKLKDIQTPEYLWIGCADSRVPANQILGLAPGEVFVQRNVGNLATHKDMNAMACLEYAVTALKVKHIIVCGHHNCGAVRAALEFPCSNPSLVNLWIADIRDVRNRHEDELKEHKGTDQVNKLVELNVLRQVFNVCTSPVVQGAWERNQRVAVHGLVYSLHDGKLQELIAPITGIDDLDVHDVGQQLSSDLKLHTNFHTYKGSSNSPSKAA
ncbi:hypothetical protein WJX72_001245 [[Myrmecia] bisecta]|uniref:Carbonic anhydrase n=1 Tax=[Myrmecia] bisecta TaxID=41462 RepID=A0AAW1PL49_9CHLO